MHQSIRLFIFLSLFVSIKLWAGPRPKSVTSHVYTSLNKEGLIGITEESPSDNPADNIFHVQIDQTFCSDNIVWLEYELEGVEDHTSVARSINNNRSVGGHLVKKRRGWATQYERIDGAWLRQGDNVIRFTMPEGAQYSYRVRNLKITVSENAGGETDEAIIINQASKNYYNKTAYVKGFFPENNREKIQLKIDGRLVPVFKGEFESEIAMTGTNCNVEMELIFPDGTTQCKSISFETMENADVHFAINSTVFHKEQFIDAAKTDSISLQGANLKLLSCALSNSSFLSITTLRDIDIPALDAGMVNVTAYHYGYRFLPHGTQFTKESKLKIPFDATKIPDGYTDKDIRTYYFDEQTHHWIAVNTDTLLTESSEVVSKIVHFTDYINAIIKVPESPEAEAYNSTSMKGIKAANPTAAVNLINTPQANNTGSASLSYPINIPSGRNGMQPQLAINYNSAGGNGWLGLGWNLMVPSVGIETRWGVPRYDQTNETETYSMSGEMLTPVAHRGTLVARSSGDKQFYPRIEGAFHKIIRHGNDPKSYWWEVTDKSGTRYFYGGSPETQLDKTAVLRDDEEHDTGNIAHWALTETRDLNGNFVKYHYAPKVPNTGLENGSVKGYQLYIDNITYTGHNGSEGLYKIIFTRENGRPDVTISANLGFKEVTADRLKKIDVQFSGASIRSYVLDYNEGEFHKSLLSTIREFDAKGKLFNTHTFDYFNDVRKDGVFKPLEDEGKPWTMPGIGTHGDFLTHFDGFTDEATALSGTKSTDISAGATVSVGFGVKVWDKSASAGVSFGYSEASSDGVVVMIDINGDGLQDKVYTKGSKSSKKLVYCPNLSGTTDKESFGAELPIYERNDFYKEKSKSVNYGIEAIFGVFTGVSHSTTTSKTTVYFTDVNGDQLPDLVSDGVVFFNTIDKTTGAITFTRDSNKTPSKISEGGQMSSDLLDKDALLKEQQKAIDQNPLLDIVRMWRAPYPGTIKVTAPVQLLQSSDPKRATSNADGVRVAIQFKGTEIWNQRILADDYSIYQPQLDSITVQTGDRLFFRVGSVDNGFYDSVSWNPVIEYGKAPVVDANNKSLNHFKAADDFVFSSFQTITPPINGQVRISSVFEKPQTTDDVLLLILRATEDTNGHLTPADTIWRKSLAWNKTFPSLPDTTISVNTNELYSFKAVSQTNIDWPSLKWIPKMTFWSSDDPSVDLTKNPIESVVVPHYSLFVNPLSKSISLEVKLKNHKKDTLTVTPVIGFKDQSLIDAALYPYTGLIIFSVKKADTLLAKQTLRVIQGVLQTPDSVFKIPVRKGDKLFAEYHTENFFLAQGMNKIQAEFKGIEKDTTVNVGLHTVIPHDLTSNTDDRNDVIFGTLYRGWGHFGWNGNRDKATAPIDETKLKVSDQARTQKPIDDSNLSGEDLDKMGTYDATKDDFSVLIASGKDQRWAGYDHLTFLTPNVISSSRVGDKDLSLLQYSSGDGTGASGIDKISKSSSNSFAAGIAVINGNYSDGYSHTLTDFMDMNGDHYPDIVSEKVIQYTDARGGLSSKTLPVGGDVQRNHSTTTGIGLAGSNDMVMPKFRAGVKSTKGEHADAGDAKAAANISGSGSFAKGDNNIKEFYADVNGDGLPDRVDAVNKMVALNIGYGFTAAEHWNFDEVQTATSETKSGGASLGFSKGRCSIAAGFSLAKSDNNSEIVMQDMNGDGLADLVNKGNPMQVRLNTGNSFAPAIPWNGASTISENATASESANLSFTIGFTIWGIKFTVNPSISGGHAMSRELSKFTDINGDGFPDYIISTSDNNLTVTKSTIGRTNLLKSVQRPLGASFTMNYHRMGNNYDLPHNVWVMDSVKVFDGFKGDGADEMLTTYSYENGIYDRHERESYGFSKVTTHTHNTQDNNKVYTTVTQTFNNTNYYNKGLLLSETMTDGAGKKYVVKSNTYDFIDIKSGSKLTQKSLLSDDGNAFPALINTGQQFFEGRSDAGKTTSMRYGYDLLGNVITYTDNGDTGTEDDLNATITYHNVIDKYITGTPKSIIVKNGSTVLRKRESTIDQNTGEVTKISQYLDDKNIAVHDMQYDSYGNLIKMTRPVNSTGQRLSIDYVYDEKVFQYPIKVSNSYGYSSSADYDFAFGQKVSSTDLNGNIIKYTLDDLGRVSTIIGPYENGGGSNYTIKFKYHLDSAGALAWALTSHFDPQNPKNALQTSIFVDGLGRVLQTKKDVAIFGGDGKADTEMMSVSGRVEFDAFGRTVSAWYPITEAVGKPGEFNPTKDTEAKYPTLTTYDVMNRTLTVILPDQSETKTDYGFGSDRDGNSQFSTKTTDANGKQTEQFTDVRGRVTSVKNYTSGSPVWTSFKYNAINEQIEATDDLKHTTFSTYDNFGRRTVRKHPDAGTTTYTYDLAGNLQQLLSANLAASGQSINYTYDFERLMQITYPQNPENNVKYTYGAAGEKDNRVGRIALQEDATGAQEFFYGPLGEVVKNIRTVVIPGFSEQTFTTQWNYDTWNRLTSMIYPDGETVTYNYNLGGLLHDMTGSKKSANFSYVKQLGYDKFEQRVFLAYGNGTKTTYDYEPDRRRLKNMTAQTSAKRAFMDNVYTYDKVNNILDLTNKAPVPAPNLMGGPSEYKYSYDDLYRLTSASGNYKGANDEESYTLAMSYNSVGGILTKDQNHLRKGVAEKKTTYNNSYKYGDAQPHAPIHIGTQTFSYDANGNQLGWKDDVSGQRRNIMWDEENRIRAIEDNGSFFHYVYDASGQRVLKGQSSGQRIFVNGQWKSGGGQMGNYTVYVNPYIVLKSSGYTKHFYIEHQRILSKLGGGWDNNGQGPLKAAGDGKVDYNGKRQQLSDGIVKNLKFLGADGQILTAGKSGKVPPGQVNGTGNITEAYRYFFHPDHLGSTSYVTDASGEVYQHLEYFAFGETFVDEHSNTNKTPYLFNGKEIDEETGLYYYGARYYDPKTSVWLCVDPIAEKYPKLSPYNFVDNNPVNNEDPDGNIIIYGKYRKEARAAMRYLAQNSPSARRDINRLRWSFRITKISGSISGGAKSEYDPRKITWKPFKASTNSEGDIQSPAVFLAHELHHSAESLRDKTLADPNSARNQERDPVTGNKTVEEQTVQHESKVVDELNANVKDGSPEGKRKNYSDNGTDLKVDSPTSNTPVEKYSEKTRDRIRKVEKIPTKTKE